MRVGIHQPNFMPWFGYFNKIYNSDTFILLDSVKCSKNSFFNRNKFKSGKSNFWLTIPLPKSSYSKTINSVTSSDSAWIQKHIKYFKNSHSKTTEKKFLDSIIEIYQSRAGEENINISNFNIDLISLVVSFLDIEVNILRSSDLEISNTLKKQDLVIDILKKTSATVYISGTGAKKFQESKDFDNIGIDLKYNNIPETIDRESIIDYILREGKWTTLKKMTLV